MASCKKYSQKKKNSNNKKLKRDWNMSENELAVPQSIFWDFSETCTTYSQNRHWTAISFELTRELLTT